MRLKCGIEPGSSIVCAYVQSFKYKYLGNQRSNRNQNLPEASLGWGKGCIRSSHRVIMGKWCLCVFLAVFDWIIFIHAGKDDIHKSLNEFEIGQISSAAFDLIQDIYKSLD